MEIPPLRPFAPWLAWALATTLGLGDRVPAPGTLAGSLPAAAVWYLASLLLPSGAGLTALALAVALPLAGVAVWAAGVEGARRGVEDPGPVVIDEVAGQWLCLLIGWLILGGLPHPPTAALVAAGGFVLFRAFDVAKPWPIGRLERIPGGLGIVADDLAAGAIAGLLLGLVWRFLA